MKKMGRVMARFAGDYVPLGILASLWRPLHDYCGFGYDNIFCDITNICNLRCPFCFVDWREQGDPVFISKKNFRKALRMAVLSNFNTSFHIACRCEPTLHPQFGDLLAVIPRSLQKFTILTTNLTTPISDDTLDRLCRTGLSYLNISIESFNPRTYEKCRRGARFATFIDNLERLVRCVDRHGGILPLRFITLVLGTNLDEIPSIIETCATRYRASMHEVRHFFISPVNASEAWYQANTVSLDQWRVLSERLRKVPQPHSVWAPPELGMNPAPGVIPSQQLWITARGEVTLLYGHQERKFYLDDIRTPFRFFSGQADALRGRDYRNSPSASVRP